MRVSEETYREMLRNGAQINEMLSVTKAGEGNQGNGRSPLLSFAGRQALPPLTLERATLRKGEKAPTEHQEQTALFRFVEQWIPFYPQLQLLFAIPNGAKLPYSRNAKGQRYSKQAKVLKDEGLQAGVPDMFLPVPGYGIADGSLRPGLFLELKRADRSNHPSDEQKWWIGQLRRYGYECAVCYGASEAWDVIRIYLRIGQDG